MFMLSYIKKHCREFVAIAFSLAIVSSIVSIVSVIFIRVALNDMITKKSMQSLVVILLANFTISIVAAHLTSVSNNIVIPIATQKFQANMHRELYEKAAEIDLLKYDDPLFFNKYIMALNNSDSRALSVLSTYTSLLSATVNSIGMITLMLSINQVVIFLIIALNVLVSIYCSSISSTITHKFNLSLVANQRKNAYVKRVFYQNNYACDIRTTRIIEVLFRILHDTVRSTRELTEKWGWKNYRITLIQHLTQAIITLLTMLYLSKLYITGVILAGDFAAVLSSINLLISSLKILFSSIPQLYEHSLYIENFKEFFLYKPSRDSIECEEIGTVRVIKIDNCSFEYEEGNKILENINMEINIGEKIGIIGSNGAGKTTFIKLIAGLYKPLGGDIFLNDRNYSELSKKFFIQNFAVLFQNYEIYATSIAENVLMKPIENLEIESLLVEDALKNVGLWEKIRKLEHGIFTPLLKEFNEAACAFSTGEYQRIALARIFTKKYSFVILDEPFSHVDKNSVELILNNLIKKNPECGIVLVTHDKTNLISFDRVYNLERKVLSS